MSDGGNKGLVESLTIAGIVWNASEIRSAQRASVVLYDGPWYNYNTSIPIVVEFNRCSFHFGRYSIFNIYG